MFSIVLNSALLASEHHGQSQLWSDILGTFDYDGDDNGGCSQCVLPFTEITNLLFNFLFTVSPILLHPYN